MAWLLRKKEMKEGMSSRRPVAGEIKVPATDSSLYSLRGRMKRAPPPAVIPLRGKRMHCRAEFARNGCTGLHATGGRHSNPQLPPSN